jgi:NAD+ synthase (glutamine-hydrolysing)
MKIALAQINYHIGNFNQNISKVKSAIHKARSLKADLVVFAELAVSGYPPRDFLEFSDFIDRCYGAIADIAIECTDIAVIIGGPSRNPDQEGKPLYNSAFFLEGGRIKEVRHKSLLPNYDVFDEYRYFEPNREFDIIEFKGSRIALTICEDLWMLGTNPLYTLNPMDELAKKKPDFIVNIAASPFHYGQPEKRLKVLSANALKYQLPLFYVNHVGAQTELLFDGGSMALLPDGRVAGQLKVFHEDFAVFDTDHLHATDDLQVTDKTRLIHDALVMGISNYFEKLGFNKAILGLSGGIDSAVVMVLAAKALGPENVLGVLLPSAFSSDHSVNDAKALADNLGCPYEIISIEGAYEAVKKSLEPNFRGLPFDLTEENMQARLRAVLLMALSNKFGYILLNTSNKSESAVGYGTLYGDMCGGLSVLGDIYKTEVYELAACINRDKEIIPENIIQKPPSAELRPGQKDSDSLPDYTILDQILYQYIEQRQGPRELAGMGFDRALVDRILKMVNTNEYKRYQTPPILRVSEKAFGMGRRMPIVAKYLS